MKIVVMSDSHGNVRALQKIFDRMADSADMFIHLGDGEADIERMKEKYPALKIYNVAGNCDWSSMAPSFKVIEADGVKLFACHGHNHGVKYGYERLFFTAIENGCKLAMFGHTHERFEYYNSEHGIYLYNPGSCSSPHDGNKPSFGVVDITKSGIVLNTLDV